MFLSSCFCWAVRLVGNLMLYLMMKLPLSPGFFEMGMPWPGYESVEPGDVGPALSRVNCLPSMVVTARFHPVKASFSGSSTVWIRSSPSRT